VIPGGCPAPEGKALESGKSALNLPDQDRVKVVTIIDLEILRKKKRGDGTTVYRRT